VQWLKSTSKRLQVWLGAGFFEADGADFYDTFVVTAPDGEEAGRVRKALPAEGEAYFFLGDVGPHILDTAIGKIGIGICAESYYCMLPTELIKQSADLALDATLGTGHVGKRGFAAATWDPARVVVRKEPGHPGGDGKQGGPLLQTAAERDQRLLSWPLGDRRFRRDCATVHGR